MLEVKDLGKRFNREWIFRKMDFTFESGKLYAITGPNGSGKSTLMQILWGQSPPTTGGLTYTRNSTPLAIDDVFKHVAIATPYMDLVDEFTLREQVDFHFKLRKVRNGLSTEALIEKMYLTPSIDKAIGNFSSGMRQRVKLALAFYTEADMLFLDEPGTNLDKTAFDWYLEQLQQRDPALLTFIASNNPDEYPHYSKALNILDFK